MRTRPFLLRWLATISLLAAPLACGGGGGNGGGGSNDGGGGSKPTITTFTVTPQRLTSSQQVTLAWTVSGATSLLLDPGASPVTGTGTTRTVTETTTFTLTATNAQGSTTAQATVTLAPAGTVKIAYLHHSTGGNVWDGGVPAFFTTYNHDHTTNYEITSIAYPDTPYPWSNYPYDYWNLWVKPGGAAAYPGVPTLEQLVAQYDVIVFKHCFPVSAIGPDSDCNPPSVSSEVKTVANYKLQYDALKARLRTFPSKKFIVWTGAALKQSETTLAQAQRAKAFFDWVKTTWDEKGDNLFVWDFWALETAGSAGDLYLNDTNATGDSHPAPGFCQTVAPLVGKRIVDVIEERGDSGSLTGE